MNRIYTGPEDRNTLTSEVKTQGDIEEPRAECPGFNRHHYIYYVFKKINK